jgi:hypothetical protein
MYGIMLSCKYWYEKLKDWLVSVGFTTCTTFPVMFTRKEDNGTLIRIIVYIDDFLQFTTSDTARDKFPNPIVDRFNVELQGLSHWYISPRMYQDKDFHITMDQSRYAKSIVRRFLEVACIKKSNMPHRSILPLNYVLNSKGLTTTPD